MEWLSSDKFHNTGAFILLLDMGVLEWMTMPRSCNKTQTGLGLTSKEY